MAISLEFDYHKPKSLKEASRLCAKYKDKARILAGGTDLINWIKEDAITPKTLIDIKGIPELKKIKASKNSVFIGANVTFEELLDSAIIKKRYPLIFEMAKTVASVGIRNRATLTGNICAAVPSCDAGPVLLVYDQVEIVAVSQGKTRKIKIKDWFIGPKKTSLKKNELVKGITIKNPGKCGASYVKLGRYKGEDLAQASVAVIILPGNKFRVSCGAVGPKPLKALKTEALLNNNGFNPETLRTAKTRILEEISPIDDIRASKEYRNHMMPIMLERGINAALSRLTGNGPKYGTSFL
ncbi:FAD binding domain-containing protein [Elusimicrobiota bacterium]